MASSLDRKAALPAADEYIDLGFAVHLLHPKSKAPKIASWSNAKVHTKESLRAAYEKGDNLGFRPGEPSRTEAGYIYVIDLDIRKESVVEEAWARLRELWPDVDDFPMVVSGSGGESRHIFMVCDKPFNSHLIERSEGYSTVFDAKKGRDVKKRDWEIDFFGSGKNVVLPPSIHPDTSMPYRWIGDMQDAFKNLDMDLGPIVPATLIESWEVTEDAPDDADDVDSLMLRGPVGYSMEEIEELFAGLPPHWIEDRDCWVNAGMAVHHETGGSDEGYSFWCDWAAQSEKFDLKDSASVWKSFKGKKDPVRLPTIIKEVRHHSFEKAQQAAFVDDEPDTTTALVVQDDPEGDLLADDDDEVIEGVVIGPNESEDGDLLSDVFSPSMMQADAPKKSRAGWDKQLKVNSKDLPESTLPNIQMILANDPRLVDVIAYNQFSQRTVVIKEPIRADRALGVNAHQLDGFCWKNPDPLVGINWTDSHEFQLRRALESEVKHGGYSIKITDRDMKAAVNNVANDNPFHPIREIYKGQKWDGVKRLDTIFIDYLGAEDNAYHRETSRLWFMGLVTRIFEPGHKFDFVPILEGKQGAGKSTFVRAIGLNKFAGELVGDFSDRVEMVQLMEGNMVMELAELEGVSRVESPDLKALVTSATDCVRLPYGHYPEDYPSQCVFIGTTNSAEYLRDNTGERRFWPIIVTVNEINTARLQREMPQIMAEQYHIYLQMRKAQPKGELPLYLSKGIVTEQARSC